MPRVNRVSVGGIPYHCLNRSNGRVTLFHNDVEYRHFENLLQEGVELVGMRILAYCIMPNHFHLVLYPRNDRDMSEFMRWVTTTHVRQRRTLTGTIGYGHVYQGSYKSFPVETDEYLQRLIRYVEQNPLRAKLVTRAEHWKWSSLWRREKGTPKLQKILADLPIELPSDYLSVVNTLPNEEQIASVRRCVNKSMPYGSEDWTDEMVGTYNMQSTTRAPGRPKTRT